MLDECIKHLGLGDLAADLMSMEAAHAYHGVRAAAGEVIDGLYLLGRELDLWSQPTSWCCTDRSRLPGKVSANSLLFTRRSINGPRSAQSWTASPRPSRPLSRAQTSAA